MAGTNPKIKQIKVGDTVYDVQDTTYSLASASSTSTGSVEYLEVVSFSDGVLTLTKKYLNLNEN